MALTIVRSTLILLCGASAVAAQAVVPASAVRAADSSTTPRLGQRVTVIGRVTLGWGVIDTSEVNIHVQDASGAVFVDAWDTTTVRPSVGDSVAVTGRIDRDQGRNNLEDATVTLRGTQKRAVRPIKLSTLVQAQLSGMTGQLVTIEGYVLRAQLGRGDQSLTVADTATDGVNVRVFNEDEGNALLRLDRFSPGDRLRVTGVLERRTAARNGNVRYTVYPRTASDVAATALTAQMRTRLARTSMVLFPLLLVAGVTWRWRHRKIADRMRTAQVLSETAARYRLLVDQAPIAIVVHRNGRLLFANTAFASLVGASDSATLLETCEHVMHPELFAQPHSAGRTRALVALKRPDGSVAEAEITESRIVYEGEECVQAVLYDVSERRRAEQALAESESQLRQHQKLEAVGHLAGGVAHDFNNILTAIKGNAEFLIEGCEQCGKIPSEAKEIDAAADRAAALTSQLLAFSRKQVVQPKVVELDQLIRTMQVLLRRLLPESVHQRLDLGARHGLVRADAGQIEQVLLNLAVNARDAMPMGGVLALQTSVLTIASEAEAKSHGEEITPGDYVVLTVGDTGVGMDEETRHRAFEPFYTTKQQGKGTGLGLSTVYGIVKQHEGHIRVQSQPGMGTTFRIYLPRVTSALESSGALVKPVVPDSAGETILVVEDEMAIRRLAARTLEQHGYKVIAAADGEAALMLARSHEGPIHLLLTDVVLPGMSGNEIASRLQDAVPSLQVLFMSGYTDDHISRHGVLEPGVDLIEKPFTPSQLLERVGRVLSGPVTAGA